MFIYYKTIANIFTEKVWLKNGNIEGLIFNIENSITEMTTWNFAILCLQSLKDIWISSFENIIFLKAIYAQFFTRVKSGWWTRLEVEPKSWFQNSKLFLKNSRNSFCFKKNFTIVLTVGNILKMFPGTWYLNLKPNFWV